MSEQKSYGFEKPITKTHMVAFRLDDQHWNTLQELFTVLNVSKDRMTDRMLLFIDRIGGLVEKVKVSEREKLELERKVRRYEDDTKKLNYEAQKMVIANKIQKTKNDGSV